MRRVADMDADGVFDGLDSCPIDANADQHDLDDDGKTLIVKAEHARAA